LATAAVFALAVPAMAVEHGGGASHDHHGGTTADADADDETLTREERREQRRAERRAEREAERQAEGESEDGHDHGEGEGEGGGGGGGGSGGGGSDDSDETGASAIISLDDPRVTADQRTAAQSLVDTTTAAVAGYIDQASVEAAGYNSIGDDRTGFEHFVNFGFLTDGVELDPARVESIMFEVADDGTKRIASAMYILSVGKTMADVPDIAGELTTWHDHQDLCWDGNGRIVGLFRNGACRPAGTLIPTPPMLHVWVVPNDCGPFAGIEGHGEAC
jgi:hypothetical protein